MNNVFKQLLLREFGQKHYNKMVDIILCDEEDHLIHPEVTKLLWVILIRRTQSELRNMSERMEDAMMNSYWISKSFPPFALFCAVIVLALFLLVRSVPALVVSVAAVIFCAMWKTREFLGNRNCYVDARIILCYRVALVEARGREEL